MTYPDSLLQNQLIFRSREEAGLLLSRFLQQYKSSQPLILGLPRGGVSIGYQVSKTLKADLDVIVANRIKSPDRPDLSLGAVSENSVVILDSSVINLLGYTEDIIQDRLKNSLVEVDKHVSLYRGNRILDLQGRNAIIVDDGLSTGAMALAAVTSVSRLSPLSIIYATPICNYDTATLIRSRVTELVCLSSPHSSISASFYYHDFDQVTDQEILLYVNKNESTKRGVSRINS